jgi:cytochrome c-type biogenesis protein CcmH
MRPPSDRRAIVALAVFAALAALVPAIPARAAGPGTQQEVEGRLMCYCGCANLTIRDCGCGTAAGIKADIAARLAAGQTPDQVVAAYVSQHGEQIRSAPERSGFNLFAWIMPFAAILAGAVMIIGLTRRWQAAGAAALPAPDTLAGGATATPADRETLERIAREMRDTL